MICQWYFSRASNQIMPNALQSDLIGCLKTFYTVDLYTSNSSVFSNQINLYCQTHYCFENQLELFKSDF